MPSSIVLGCPTGGNIVVTPGSGACSGCVGTICVWGNYFESRPEARWIACLMKPLRWLKSWLAGWFKPALAGPVPRTTGISIRVRVLNGHVTVTSAPTDMQCWDANATPNPQYWCASPVQVPAVSDSGAPLTVVAWKVNADGSTDTSCPVATAWFFGGGPDATDCCSGCSGGSGSGTSLVARELASRAPLEVAVPDGPNAGLHRATAIASFVWGLTLRGVAYQLCCDSADGLVIRGPSFSAGAASVETGPFSAVFPGDVFGSAGDVVVTVA